MFTHTVDRVLNLLTDNTDLEPCGMATTYLLNRVIVDLRSNTLDLTTTTTLSESLIDLANHQILVYPYKDVPACWRRLLTDASLGMACCLSMRLNNECGTTEVGWETEQRTWRKVIKVLDLAIVVAGAPGTNRREIIDEFIDRAQQRLTELRRASAYPLSTAHVTPSSLEPSSPRGQKRPRLEDINPSPSTISSSFPPLTLPENYPLVIHPIHRPTPIPSLLSFSSHINSPNPTPLIISEGAISHWPAFHPPRIWSDPSYLLSVAADRVVPVEIGSRYTDEAWTQRMMRFGDFVNKYVLEGAGYQKPNGADGSTITQDAPLKPCTSIRSTDPKLIAYLAQHDLLAQIPRLRRDIAVPDYCYLSPEPTPEYPTPPATSDAVITNAWFGPRGTVSPLHHDPYHNLLAQVVGRKFVRLYAPGEVKKLYPFEGMLENTSQVDVEKPDHAQFPAFADAKYVEGILSPGEMLYIPPKWWHYVRSLDVSFSVSFWF
ncbi:hypothetical protein BC938DRAFT_479174 [Jimgerdemannia flammicorona]|uniref:JmjC domain-containing protein n=1 Tax=Jimgerdemannia flammicorona TaxID=994334 RepID=A0A433QXZ4_9FUNG|nr:hypothetical protein BC938DRAFT_479174 [Jimgerdemannia flammicorona]